MQLALFSVFLVALTGTDGQSFPPTPVIMRGLWCVARWTQSSQTYTPIGQAFFYNNATFTMNYLDNPSYTWINNFLVINNTDGSGGTYQVFTNTTRGPAPYLNTRSCFWRRQIANGDIMWGRQSNGTCTPTFEEDTTSESTRYTRNPSTCRLIDDENTNMILSSTSFEIGELLPYDRLLASSKRQGVVFYGSSSIRMWTTLSSDFSAYTVLNRGFGGSTLTQCLQQWKRLVYPLEPSVIILYAGENDIAAGQTPVTVQSVFRQTIPAIRHFYPSIPIGFIALKPTPSRVNKLSQMNETNSRIREDIQLIFRGVTFIDIWPQMLTPDGQPRAELFLTDMLHMNGKGYAIWTKAVNDYLQSLPNRVFGK